MAKQIQLRRDTASRWTSFNPLLLEGEFGIETDTKRFKLGDGINSWNSLPYGGPVGVQPIPLKVEMAFDELHPSNYSENNYNVAGQVTNVDIWDSSAKNIHLFSKVFTYAASKLSRVQITLIPTGSMITKTIAYSGGKIANVTRVYTP